jgi:hypothetical protein
LCGAFEIEGFGRGFHLLHQLGLKVAAFAVEEAHGLKDQLAISHLIDAPHARRAAALDLKQQAGAGAALEHRIRTGAQEEGALQRIQGAIDRPGRCEGPEIDALGRARAAMFEQLREGVVLAQQNVGEGFVVAIRDVVARLEPLDQIGFKQQRFGLRRRGDEQHLAGLRDHPGDTLGMPARFGVRRNPLLERFSLADVKHRPVGRQHAIDARPIGQRLHISLNPGHALQRHFGTVRRVGHRQSAKFSIFSRATLQAATSWVHSFSKF